MTLKEAIESLITLEAHPVIKGWSQSRDAIKLGIEALKETMEARYGDPALDGELLPGETESE